MDIFTITKLKLYVVKQLKTNDENTYIDQSLFEE